MTVGPTSSVASALPTGSSDLIGSDTTALAAAARASGSGPDASVRDNRIAFYKERIASLQKLLGLHIPESFRAKIETDIKDFKEVLTRETALNLLTNVSWGSGASASTVKTLDNLEIEIVPDAQLEGASAVYDEDSDTVLLAQSVFDQIEKSTASLSKQGLLDLTSGKIKDPSALQGNAAYHNLVSAQALTLLEGTHKADLENGQEAVDDAHFDDVTAFVRQQLADSQSLPADARAQKEAELKHYLLAEYLGTYELNSYQAQEKHMFELGQPPQEHGWLTIDNNGNYLDKEKAANNLIAFLPQELKDTLWSESLNPTDVSAAGGDVGEDHPGRLHPGRLHPGRLHPGRLHPGRLHPGRLHPGRLHPGRLHPGRLHPGVAEFVQLPDQAVANGVRKTSS